MLKGFFNLDIILFESIFNSVLHELNWNFLPFHIKTIANLRDYSLEQL